MSKKYTHLGETLRKLLFNRNMRAVDLSREVNLPPPTIHRLITGKSTRPYNSSLKPIADYFGLTVDQLLSEPTSPNHEKHDSKKALQDRNLLHELPLIPWGELNTIDRGKINDKIPFLGKIGELSFATTMQDSSMEPIFARGSLLIFDPERQEKDRNYILVQLYEGGSTVLRQLILDGSARYLKSLNNDLHSSQIRALASNDKILGVLVECRTHFDNH